MAQMRKVVVDVIVPVPRMEWSVQGLARSLRSLAGQVAGFSWRVVVIDGTRSGLVRQLVEVTLPRERVIFETLHLRTGMLSDLLYQGVGSSKARYLTYLREGGVWEPDHLRRMVGAARQSRSDVVVCGGVCLSHDHVADLIEAGLDPCAGGDVLHTSEIMDAAAGWPRGRGRGFEADVWRSMFLAGAEFFAMRRPVDTHLVKVDSTLREKQMMLFPDA